MSHGAFFVSQDPTDPRDIHFKVASAETVIPGDQQGLRDEVERALGILRQIYPQQRDQEFRRYFRQLLSLAQTGLVGVNAQPELAFRALANLKREITDREAGRVKNQYMKSLGERALLLGAPAAVLAYVLQYVFDGRILVEAAFLSVWAACMAGCWLSFGARKPLITFEDLHVLEADRVEPLLRLIFAGMAALTFALLLSTGAIDISLGALKGSNVLSNYRVAVVTGVLAGIAEQVLPSKLLRRASAVGD